MCYAISLTKSKNTLVERFCAQFADAKDFQPFYYQSAFEAPKLPVILDAEPEVIQSVTWGLIPFWVKTEDQAKEIRFQTANARSETIHQKASFRAPIMSRRCLILADGFFEWRHYKQKKYPYYITLNKQEPFAIAGIWDVWQNPGNKRKIKTFSVITTQANPLMSKIHNKKRMPVILHYRDEKNYLKSGLTKEQIDSFFESYSATKMQAYPVSKLIVARGVEHNVKTAIEPFEYKELS